MPINYTFTARSCILPAGGEVVGSMVEPEMVVPEVAGTLKGLQVHSLPQPQIGQIRGQDPHHLQAYPGSGICHCGRNIS